MALTVESAFNELRGHGERIGMLGNVLNHEPKAAPEAKSVTLAWWLQSMRPARSSGLNSVSLVVTFTGRFYTSTLTEPQDAIDPTIVNAADAFLASLMRDYTLGGWARHIDIFGAETEGLVVEAGYLTQDQKLFRILSVTVPIVINDAYSLEPA